MKKSGRTRKPAAASHGQAPASALKKAPKGPEFVRTMREWQENNPEDAIPDEVLDSYSVKDLEAAYDELLEQQDSEVAKVVLENNAQFREELREAKEGAERFASSHMPERGYKYEVFEEDAYDEKPDAEQPSIAGQEYVDVLEVKLANEISSGKRESIIDSTMDRIRTAMDPYVFLRRFEQNKSFGDLGSPMLERFITSQRLSHAHRTIPDWKIAFSKAQVSRFAGRMHDTERHTTLVFFVRKGLFIHVVLSRISRKTHVPDQAHPSVRNDDSPEDAEDGDPPELDLSDEWALETHYYTWSVQYTYELLRRDSTGALPK